LGAVTLAAASLSSCGLSLKPDPIAFDQAQKAYVELVSGQDDQLMSQLPKEVQNPTTRRTMAAMRAILPPGQATPAKLVGWNDTVGTSGHVETVVMLYDYPGEHILAQAQFTKTAAGALALANFNVRGATDTETRATVFLTGDKAPPVVDR